MNRGLIPFLNRHAPVILTVLGAAGTVGTAILAAKATPKALQRKYDAEQEQEAPLTKLETAAVMAPAYIPAASVCFATLLCIFGANALNQKQQAALASAYAMLSKTFSKYRKKANEPYGEETDYTICKAMAQDKGDAWTDQKLWWHIEGQPGYFERTKEEVFDAEYKFLRNYRLRGEEACLNDLYEMLELPKIDEGDRLGWTADSMECDYGYFWIDIEHRPHTLDDGSEVIEITMPVWAHENYLSDPDGCW